MSRNIKTILNQLQTSAKKDFGQHFLINKNKIDFITRELSDRKDTLIIEIGPGLGSITEKILESSNNVLCIEKDKIFSQYLKDKFKNKKNFILIEQDILRVNLNKIAKSKKAIVFGNLPYNIASQIIIKFVDELHDKGNIGIFMCQKEVAERILSSCGSKSYNAFTLKIKSFFDVKKLLDLNENDFWPAPKIKSTLVKLAPKEIDRFILDEYIEFSRFLTNCFHIKRKTLMNNLQNLYLKKEILPILKKLEKKENVRAEELKEEEFIKLFKYLKNYK